MRASTAGRRAAGWRTGGWRTAAIVSLALVVALVTVLAPVTAWSWWSARASVAANAAAATVAAPVNLGCATQSPLLLPSARLSWQAPAGAAPSNYEVVVSDGTHSGVLKTLPGTELTYTVTVGIITDGVLGWLVSLLTNGGTANVTVRALQSGWVSAATNAQPIRLALTGVRCA